MTRELQITKVGDVAQSVSETHKRSKENLVFLNTSDILHGKFLHRTYSAIKDWPGQAKKSIRKDDILFSEIRPANGRWAYVDEAAEDFVVSTKLMVIRAKQDRLFPRFLYQFLTSPKVAGWLQHLAESRSGTFPQITFDQVAALDIPLPPLPEQKAIAAVLGALDDKIELNRRMNATLEAMARALFQSWFVDFDPVRAKAEGRPPTGLDEPTAALFPAQFQPSELGEIPQGWRIMKVADFIKRLPVGQKYDQKTVSPCGKVPVFDQGKSGIIGFHDNEPGVTATLDKPVAVFANHTCYMRLITYSFSAIQNVLPFVGLGVDTFWAYYATEGRLSFSEYKGHWPDFVIQESVVPSSEMTKAFGKLTKPMVAQIRKNEEQSRTLATLRDALLPKLLTGEFSVSAVPDEKHQIT